MTKAQRRALERMVEIWPQRTAELPLGTLQALERKGLVAEKGGVYWITADGHDALGNRDVAKGMRMAAQGLHRTQVPRKDAE